MCNIPEEHRPHVHQGESLTSHLQGLYFTKDGAAAHFANELILTNTNIQFYKSQVLITQH